MSKVEYLIFGAMLKNWWFWPVNRAILVGQCQQEFSADMKSAAHPFVVMVMTVNVI